MKNRLQFRYHVGDFPDRDAAYKYINETINNPFDNRGFSSLISEPLVSYYLDKNGNRQVLFLIGMGGDGQQNVNENVKYFILDGAKLNEGLDELKEIAKALNERVDDLEIKLLAEIERSKKKDDEHDTLINKLFKDLADEIAARKSVDGQEGPNYKPNEGTTQKPIYYIYDAESLNDADMKLDSAIKKVEDNALVNININGVSGNVEDNIASVEVTGNDIYLTGYKLTDKVTSHPVTDEDNLNTAFARVQKQIDTTQSGAGLSSKGEYEKEVSSKYISGATNIHDATVILDKTIADLYGGEAVEHYETIHKIGYAISAEIENRVESDNKLSERITENSNSITDIKNYSINGKYINSATTLNGNDIKLGEYSPFATVQSIEDGDTINQAFGKLETRVLIVSDTLDAESKNIDNIEGELVTIKNNIKTNSDNIIANKIVPKDTSIKVGNKGEYNGNTSIAVNIDESQDNALVLHVGGLYIDKSALTTYSGENAIVVDLPTSDNNKKISLKLNTNDNILINDGAGLRADISMVYNKDEQSIKLYGKSIDGVPVTISEINVGDFIADGMIKNVEYNPITKDLTITWNILDQTGEYKKIVINFKDLIDVYKAGNGLSLSDNTFSVLVDETECDKINDSPILLVTERGVKVVGVANAINIVNDNITGINKKIDIEKERAEGKENELSNAIREEIERSEKADYDFGVKLGNEATRAITEEQKINARIDANIITMEGLGKKIDTNSKNIQSEVDRAKGVESGHTENIALNRRDINKLMGNEDEPGSVLHSIMDSLHYETVNPDASEAKDQTLLRRISGESVVYASNNSYDMVHGGEQSNGNRLSLVIDQLLTDSDNQQKEIDNLNTKISGLTESLNAANEEIDELKRQIEAFDDNLIDRVKEIMSKYLVGTNREIKVITNTLQKEDGSIKVDTVQLGFADDAIFNATKN